MAYRSCHLSRKTINCSICAEPTTLLIPLGTTYALDECLGDVDGRMTKKKGTNMIGGYKIKPEATVVCSQNIPFAIVDHMEGMNTIRLKKDESGQHHYIPLSWIKSVDKEVHLDRPCDQAMREWTTAPPSPGRNKATMVWPASL